MKRKSGFGIAGKAFLVAVVLAVTLVAPVFAKDEVVKGKIVGVLDPDTLKLKKMTLEGLSYVVDTNHNDIADPADTLLFLLDTQVAKHPELKIGVEIELNIDKGARDFHRCVIGNLLTVDGQKHSRMH